MTKKIKQLYRSRSNRVVLGVCGGLADYLEIDPILVRASTIVIAVLSGGAGILAYLLVVLLIPLEPNKKS